MDQNRSAMLKWCGDYTLPRFRAKLAIKHLLHPDVEPGYKETYRADLGGPIIQRTKESIFADIMDRSLGREGTRRVGSPLDGRPRSRGPTRRGDTGYSSQVDLRSPSGWGSGTSLPPLGQAMSPSARSLSVPCLGLRSVEAPPASLAPRLGGSSKNLARTAATPAKPSSTSPSATQSLFEPASPTTSLTADDKKELEKERIAEAASRRLWVASNGAYIYLKSWLEMQKAGLQTLPLNNCPVNGITKELKKGAKLDWRNDEWDGATLLLKAVRTGALELAMYLVMMGADTTVMDKSGRGVLHWAAIEGSPLLMEYLLDNLPGIQPANLKEPDGGGDTPLHLAAYHGHIQVVRLLIRAQADPMQPNGGGFNSIQLAEARRMWHISEYLSEQKLQQDDRTDVDAPLRELMRECDLQRANKLAAEAVLNKSKKQKAKAKSKGDKKR